MLLITFWCLVIQISRSRHAVVVLLLRNIFSLYGWDRYRFLHGKEFPCLLAHSNDNHILRESLSIIRLIIKHIQYNIFVYNKKCILYNMYYIIYNIKSYFLLSIILAAVQINVSKFLCPFSPAAKNANKQRASATVIQGWTDHTQSSLSTVWHAQSVQLYHLQCVSCMHTWCSSHCQHCHEHGLCQICQAAHIPTLTTNC